MEQTKTKKSGLNKKIYKEITILDCIFLAVLVLLPFLHLAFGVEFTDTGYSLGNYENLEHMNLTWTIATFWANMVGKFFTILPMGHTWIGMKFYTTLVPVFTLLISYTFLKKYINRIIVFVGEILAISLFWCPTTILYNYLTYCLFTIVIILIIKGLEEDKWYLLLIAGIVLAFNVFVRFPNITEALLIVLVCFKGIIDKKKFSKTLATVGICIGGFIIGVAVNVLIIGLMYGFDSIPNMITSLFAMTDDNQTYKPTQMILAILTGYISYAKASILLIALTVFSFAASALIKRHMFRIITIIVQVILYGVFLFWAYKNHVYTVHYNDYSSMYFWMVAFLMLGNIYSVWTMLRRKNSSAHKLMALAVLIVIWITPLGSNNALYPSMNNLFLVAPIVLFMIWNELFRRRNFYELLDLEAKNTMVSSRVTIALLMISVMVHCSLFGFCHVFRDSGFPYNNHTAINGNSVLVGMHTNEERAETIEKLTEYVTNEGLAKNAEAVYYGNLPGLEYILGIPCAISHTWPDLGSYSDKTFEKELNDIATSGNYEYAEAPTVFVNTDLCPDIMNPGPDASTKEKILKNYLSDYGYYLAYEVGEIQVYRTGYFYVYE